VAGDGHIPNSWFRTGVWNPALRDAELGVHVTPHGLRHAHASWLLAGGADLQVVKERLGHGSIATTGQYLHTLPGAGDCALVALDAYRARSAATTVKAVSVAPAAMTEPATVDHRDTELAELREMVGQLGRMLARLAPGEPAAHP
jgi:hypothetical protein